MEKSPDNLPVIFASGGREQYPSKKLDVSKYKQDVSEIMEESIEEKKKSDEFKAQQAKNKPIAKIKQFLAPANKVE